MKKLIAAAALAGTLAVPTAHADLSSITNQDVIEAYRVTYRDVEPTSYERSIQLGVIMSMASGMVQSIAMSGMADQLLAGDKRSVDDVLCFNLLWNELEIENAGQLAALAAAVGSENENLGPHGKFAFSVVNLVVSAKQWYPGCY